MKRLLALSVLVGFTLANSLSAQTTIDAPPSFFDIFLYQKSYDQIDITENNPYKLMRKAEYVFFGKYFEINLEARILHLRPYYLGQGKRGKKAPLVSFFDSLLDSERPATYVNMLLAPYKTILVIETLVGSTDDQGLSFPTKYKTIYGLVPTEFNGKTEYKYRIIQLRTRIR